MLTKNQFRKIFDIAADEYCFADELCTVLESSESKLFSTSYQLFDFLVEEMEDDDLMRERYQGQSIIMNYLFGFDRGRAYEDGDYLCKIGEKEYSPTTTEELYDCLVEFYKKEGKVPNYHNVLCAIQSIFKFYTERRKYVWKGWCFYERFKDDGKTTAKK